MVKVTDKNLVDYIMDYESGELDEDGILELFSHLISTGKAWQLQGSIYGRPAMEFIKSGIIDKQGKIHREKLKKVIE
jgi:hypothetical protein